MPSKPVRKRVESQDFEDDEDDEEEVVSPKSAATKTVVPPGLPKQAMKQLGWDMRLTIYVGSQQELNRLINKDRDMWTAQTAQPQIVGQYELLERGAVIVNMGSEKAPIDLTKRVVIVRKLTQAELDAIKAEEELETFRREQAEAEEQEALKAWRARRFTPKGHRAVR